MGGLSREYPIKGCRLGYKLFQFDKSGLKQVEIYISTKQDVNLTWSIKRRVCGMIEIEATLDEDWLYRDRGMNTNTIRLWQPQLFAIIAQESTKPDGSAPQLPFCSVIDNFTFTLRETSLPEGINNNSKLSPCSTYPVSNNVYSNTIIISASSLLFTFFLGIFVGSINNKYLLLICYFISSCAAVSLNWSNNVYVTLTCISLFVGCLSASLNLVLSAVVNLFPTNIRTMAVSLTMMLGRIGSLIGNLLFPILLQNGCTVALMILTVLLLVACILVILIPRAQHNIK
ncbi:uncharacterized protein LOC106645104 [Copidosoma floridanum]|uniref:uncharacterized protein LOC106645104 n=1 Tax=Copidosoma floridanum TaxID=29053 RepID=UPI0006C9B737|nr:uncharacterized protein LOC106645104 [Copidosoma floridanum]